MHAPVAVHPEDGFALRPDRRPWASGKSGYARHASRRPWLRLSLGCAVAMAVLACFMERPYQPAAVTPSTPVQLVASAPPPAWTPVPQPFSINGIDARQLKPLPFAFTWRNCLRSRSEVAPQIPNTSLFFNAHVRHGIRSLQE